MLELPLIPNIFPDVCFLSFVPGHNFNKFLRGLFLLYEIISVPFFVIRVLRHPSLVGQFFNRILHLDAIVGVVVITYDI